MLQVGLDSCDYQILRLLQLATIPNLSSSDKSQEAPFKLSIIKKIHAAELSGDPGEISFTISNLEHDSRILTIFINIVKKSRSDKDEREKAQTLKAKLDSFFVLKKKLDSSVEHSLYELFRNIVRGRLCNWKSSRKETSEQIIDTLRKHLQKPDASETFLGDLADIMGKVAKLSYACSDISHFPLYEVYQRKGSEFRLVENELSIAVLFNGLRDNLHRKLEEIFEEAKNVEKGRLNNVYGPSLKQIPEQHLPKIVQCSPNCFISTQVEEKPFIAYGGEHCVAYTVRAPNLKPPQCNGDGFLFAELGDGITFSAVVDASGNSLQSKNATNNLLETLYKEAKFFLQRGCTNRQLLSHLLTKGHIAALEFETPCTLAFNFCFPHLIDKKSITCLGVAFGDSGAFLYDPKLALTEYNASPVNKLRSSSQGTLGDVFKKQLANSTSAPLKFDFWQEELPPGSFIILGTDGFRMHLEPENLLKSPVDVCQEMKFSWFEGDEEKWEAHQGLRRSYSKHLILEAYKAISEVFKTYPEESASAQKLASGLLEIYRDCQLAELSVQTLAERVGQACKKYPSCKPALELVDHLLQTETEEVQFAEQLLATAKSVQKLSAELLEMYAGFEDEGVSVQKLAEGLLDHCLKASSVIIDEVLQEKENPSSNAPGVIDDITVLVQKLPPFENQDSPWF